MKAGKKLMSIGVAAKEAGVSTQTLAYYIMVGLIKPTMVSDTNRRFFDSKAIERIKLIKRVNRSGYPLRDIKETFLDGK
jgi:DNA-binding transcriptional MerR regulator